MNQEELNKVLKLHKKWLDGEEGGVKANLRDADLRWANLRDADLRDADLRDADLRWADLQGADLQGADLRDADLRWANLRDADLRDADLNGANLNGADLRKANLQGAGLVVLQVSEYTAYVGVSDTRIGCQHHSNKQWLTFTDAEIAPMAPMALKWWHQWKPLIVAAINSLKGDV